MKLWDFSIMRLESQKITSSDFKTAGEVVGWMGAIQAQSESMSKWAIGVRMQNPTVKNIEEAFNKGDILRTHILRPTWHLVRAEDIHMMLDLSAPKILNSLKSRHKELELTESVILKCHKIIEKSLSDAEHLTRQELADLFNNAGISTDENRLSHILFDAELNRLVCSGPLKDKKQTYSMLSKRVPVIKKLSKDEALAELASRYFRSRFPATIEDFIWWSNISVTDARKAVDYIKSDFSLETVSGIKYYIPLTVNEDINKKISVLLLPAYDEFLISYRDRTSSLSKVNNRKAVSDNGIFYPLIVINGQVTGTWKRNIQKNSVTISLTFFHPAGKRIHQAISEKAKLYGEYLNKNVEIRFTSG
jgi:hypothetical protein